ncbi:nuclear transport factor 2 family protein [Pigmentiphaga sp. H8]|uniref:nuclear transport factor 2 family protein n=1 Tax=Pigmentiphaga sp. H8 TaxID=2488560 RepID=UPI000F59E36B|nr:nuclear transport factor 2 family protein [Pigmentiphaga sp. H8]AZG08235.1 nuclear transport factor 2 family protein [Pigmentiphaga sp. H8]
MPNHDALQRLLDRAAIHDLHTRYFNAADNADRALVETCFTDDVVAQYEGRPPARGREALLDQIALFRNLEEGKCRISTHFMGNLLFRSLTASFAETEINAFAFLVQQDGTTVSARSLRYLDRLRLEDGAWKIHARLHTLDWSCDVPASFARPFAQKLRGMDDWLASI